MKLIFLGLPGSGKSTAANVIAEKLKSSVINLSYDNFDDPDVINDVLRSIREVNFPNGFIFDGFPFKRRQAAILFNAFEPDAVINIKIDPFDAAVRVMGRRVDPETGIVYHVFYNTPDDDEIKSRFERLEEDEKIDDVKAHIRKVNDELKNVVEFYKEKGVLHEVKYKNSPQLLINSIMDVINNLKVKK